MAHTYRSARSPPSGFYLSTPPVCLVGFGSGREEESSIFFAAGRVEIMRDLFETVPTEWRRAPEDAMRVLALVQHLWICMAVSSVRAYLHVTSGPIFDIAPPNKPSHPHMDGVASMVTISLKQMGSSFFEGY